MPWRVICCAVRKCGRCSVAARAEVRAKLWEYGKRESAPAARRGNLSRRPAVRARPRKIGKLHLAAAAFPNALPVGRRACPAQIRRMQPAPCVCGFIQSRMAAASSVGCECADDGGGAAGCRAREKCCKIFTRCIMSVGKAAEPQCRAVAGAAFPLRLMEAGGFILRAAASDAFVVPPHFQSGILSGRACPALGFAVRRPMFRSKAAVHRASSMRIRKPANALAGKRPKHRRAKPRQRWPRPARDGRRG